MLKREAKYANYVSKNLVSRSFEVTRGQKLRQNFLEKNYVAFQNYLSRDKLEGRLTKTVPESCAQELHFAMTKFF